MPIDSKLAALANMDPSETALSQTMSLKAWAEQVTQSMNAGSLSTPPSSRGQVTSLAIPIDEPSRFKSVDAVEAAFHMDACNTAGRARREPLRRDSMKRREALSKGHEGSRRRQRWENGSC